jgi:TolB-like protein
MAELRRRHVFRVAVGYAAVAFVVLQLSEIVLPAFSAEWALQLVVVFVVLGFPVVMVLAWVFDITSDGIRVTAALDDDDGSTDRPSTGVFPRLAILAVTLLAVGGVGSWWVLNTVPGTDEATTALRPSVIPVAYNPAERIRSIAVLPLTNFSDAAEEDYFAAGMHEALIERLSQLPEIRVVSRTSVRRYADTNGTIPEIAQELGVEGVVEGSVFRAGDEVRITVQLIHGASDTRVWSQSYEREFSDVLALQSEVAGAIADELSRELSTNTDTPMLSYAPVSDVAAANDAFMRARFEQFQETPEGLQAAVNHYTAALEADPEFAGAYIGLATAELMLGLAEPSDPTESLVRARVLALKAFELDQELPEVHDILAVIDEQLSDELFGLPSENATVEPMHEVLIVHRPPTGSAGVAGGTDAGDTVVVISLDPDLLASSGDFGQDSTQIFESYTQVGRQLRAAWAGWATRSERMASVEASRLVSAAHRLNAAGRTDEAVEVLSAVCVRSPEHEEAWEALELLYASRGDYEELLEMRRMWVGHGGGDAESVDQLEEQLLRDGPEGYWEWRLAVLEERASDGEPVSGVYMAAAQASLGDTEEALASLRDAVRVRDRRLASLRTDAVWDVIRPDPRFASLVRGITNGPPLRRGRR